jgi:arsenate reductase
MSQTKIFGIKNCDTMKKAMKWLDDNGADYAFHNYKKAGIDEAVVKQAIEEHGWETVINKRGTTWRALPEQIQNALDAEKALEVAKENPSIVKRPILLRLGQTYVGFNAKQYEELF